MRFYVYALAYPDGRIFYVGKGTGDRILEHEQEARKGGNSRKCEIIREIWARGEQVKKAKLAFFHTDEEALVYESSLISSLDELANIQEGRKRIKDIALTQSDITDFGGRLRHWREDGTMFWSAREVSEFLGYITWAAFQGTIKRAIRVAHQGGWDIREHFQPAYKVVRNGVRSYRSIEDYQLSREAFWLVVQNADPSKMAVSFGKVVLALQTAIHDSPPRPHGWESLPDGIGGWSKSFGTFEVAAIADIGGTMPEDLKPEPSIKPLLDERQRKRKKAQKKISDGQLDLFSEGK
jgi:hypothetical protein